MQIILKYQRLFLVLILLTSINSQLVDAEELDKLTQEQPADSPLHFNIPAQALDGALVDYGIQAGINIVIPNSLVADYQSSPLMGQHTKQSALKHLLSKTPLTFEFNQNTQTVLLKRVTRKNTAFVKNTNKQNNKRETEEIFIVSARHRKEKLQDVPMSITLFEENDLKERGTQDIIQLGPYAVNTTLTLIQNTNTLAAFIRGVGQKNIFAGLEVGVGIYIDDVYYNRPQSVALDIYDTERIEILKGPQGTLYGRNTSGGAIKFTSKRLADETDFSLKLSAGSYSQRDILASGSTPILDNSIKIGGSIASFKRDGFGKNLSTGEDNYEKDIFALRSSIEFTPSDDLFIRIAADMTKDDSAPISGEREIRPGEESTLDNVYDTYSNTGNTNHPINDNDVVIRGISAFTQWHLNDQLTATFISAYREDKNELLIDTDSRETELADYFTSFDNWQNSQEIRLSYDGKRIHGVGGVYYLNARSRGIFDLALPLFGGVVQFILSDTDTEAWALFGNIDIELSPTINISFGARYTHDTKSIRTFQQLYSPTSSGDFISPYFGGDGFAIVPPEFDDAGNEVFPRFSGSRSDSATTPRLSLSWQPQDELHIYASYSKGFTSGGLDPRGFYTQEKIRKGFSPETVDSYELGIKSQHWDKKIRSNAAVFYSRYRDVQVLSAFEYDSNFAPVAGQSFYVYDNNASATMSGFEWEFEASLGDHLTSRLTIGIIKADYDIYNDGASNVSDQRVIQDTPENSASYIQHYRVDLGPGTLSMIGAINYRSTSHFARGDADLPIHRQSGYSLINASIVWASHSEHWQAAIHGLNLSDKKYKVSGVSVTNLVDSANVYGSPRTISATIKYTL